MANKITEYRDVTPDALKGHKKRVESTWLIIKINLVISLFIGLGCVGMGLTAHFIVQNHGFTNAAKALIGCAAPAGLISIIWLICSFACSDLYDYRNLEEGGHRYYLGYEYKTRHDGYGYEVTFTEDIYSDKRPGLTVNDAEAIRSTKDLDKVYSLLFPYRSLNLSRPGYESTFYAGPNGRVINLGPRVRDETFTVEDVQFLDRETGAYKAKLEELAQLRPKQTAQLIHNPEPRQVQPTDSARLKAEKQREREAYDANVETNQQRTIEAEQCQKRMVELEAEILKMKEDYGKNAHNQFCAKDGELLLVKTNKEGQ